LQILAEIVLALEQNIWQIKLTIVLRHSWLPSDSGGAGYLRKRPCFRLEQIRGSEHFLIETVK